MERIDILVFWDTILVRYRTALGRMHTIGSMSISRIVPHRIGLLLLVSLMRPFGSFRGICRTWPSVSFVIFSTFLLLGHSGIENFSHHYFGVKRRCVREDVEGTRIRVGIPTRFSWFGHNSSLLQPCFVVELDYLVQAMHNEVKNGG